MTSGPTAAIKLTDLLRIAGWQDTLSWQPFHAGVDIYRLYDNGPHGPRAALLRYHPGGRVPLHEHMGYEHILVLDGEQSDESGAAGTGSLTIHPPGTCHSVSSERGCIVLAVYERPVKFIEPTP